MELGVKFVVCVLKEELDEVRFKETLSKYGTVFEEQDDKLDETPVKLYYVDGNLSSFLRIQWELNCVKSEDNQYVLFPMASLSDKAEVLRARSK
ncbi:MAG: hypothetical protein IJ880_09270 [Bacilli bacterium]|nr:hypothetical protein [Bacilli bacterium]